jgi:hypothetical protein
MPETELKRAQKALSIHDAYICEAHAWADRSYNPTIPITQPLTIQIKVEPAGNVDVAQVDGGESFSHIVRYFIETGVRMIKPGVEKIPAETKRDDLIGEITAIFVLRYAWQPKEPPTQGLLAAFADNAVHHMWPYWREFLQASSARLRLPPVVLPMRVAAPPDESATAASVTSTESGGGS